MRLLQASLALVERSTLAGSIDAGVASGLLTALAERIEADGPGTRRLGVARELRGARARQAGAGRGPRRAARRRALGPPPADPVRVEWEGQRYVVDRAAATGPGSSASTRPRAGPR